MEWWVVVAIAAVAIAVVVQDNWRAYRHWWPMSGRIRADRAAEEARRQRLHDLTHRQGADELNPSSGTADTAPRL